LGSRRISTELIVEVAGATTAVRAQPIRVVRIIARLNVGGPAIQAITLTKCLEPLGYRTRLVRGREEPDEGNMDYLAGELGVRPALVPSLRRNPGWHDLPALLALIVTIRRERPQIVHTHAAKGGTLGRLAALAAGAGPRQRPILIHTYHGHSLTGYFSPRSAAVYRQIERLLARYTDRLIAVSDEVRDELVKLGVAAVDRFEVVPLGFDLKPFDVAPAERRRRRDRLRGELDIPADDQLVTLIARLVPIKRVDRFLRVARMLTDERPGLHFLVVGDGELREQLHASPEAVELDGRLTWAGFRRDIPDVCFASDAVVLTSDNEGTPVSLIEARAAGTPVVATRVGGVGSVVRDETAGFIVDVGDEQAMATAVARVLDDATVAERARAESREVVRAFSLDALVERVDSLYRELLASADVRAAWKAIVDVA
jgi:glycosyltransferase involved in cell wall biosynthesis